MEKSYVLYKREDMERLSTLICMLPHKGFDEANIMCNIQNIIDHPLKEIKKGVDDGTKA